MKRISALFSITSTNKAKSRIVIVVVLLVLYVIFARIACNYNNYPVNDWRSELFSDKGGYYIYLPATFIKGYNNPSAYPEGIDQKMGKGFRFENGKLFTKFTAGVAILVTPFFLIAHIIALTGDGPADGFTHEYYVMANYASVFYMLLGSVFLFLFLRRRFSWWISLITITFLVMGSNVFYYTFREPMMSHIYSFAMFSLLLLLTDNLWQKRNWRNLLGVALVSGMIILIRPLNAIFLLIIPFLDNISWKQFVERLRFLFAPLNLLTFIVAILLILSPQLIYWKFISGKLFFYSYDEEGFTFWNHPQIAEVLFAAENGLFIYSPIFVFVIAGFICMIIRKERNRWLIPALFLILLYMLSSWWAFHFGCSFGQRSFVEFYPLFALPVASLLKLSYSFRSLIWKVLVSIVIAYLLYFNISLSNIYGRCFPGETWDYSPYLKYFNAAKIFPFQRHVFKWHDDFEKKSFYSVRGKNIIKNSNAFNGEYLCVLNATSRYSGGFYARLNTIIPGKIYKAEVEFECFFVEPPDETLVVCSISKDTTKVYDTVNRIDNRPESIPGSWIHYKETFELPDIPSSGFIKIFIWGVKGTETYIDEMHVSIFFDN